MAAVAIDQLNRPNLASAVEHVVILVLPWAAFAGHVGAAKDHLKGNKSGYEMIYLRANTKSITCS
jgi:hypothetical protein